MQHFTIIQIARHSKSFMESAKGSKSPLAQKFAERNNQWESF
jgi:hypothetical protein